MNFYFVNCTALCINAQFPLLIAQMCSKGTQKGQTYLSTDKQTGRKQTKRSRNQAEGVTQTQSILHELSESHGNKNNTPNSGLQLKDPSCLFSTSKNQPYYYFCSGRSWLVKYSVWEGWRKLFECFHNKVHSEVTKAPFSCQHLV